MKKLCILFCLLLVGLICTKGVCAESRWQYWNTYENESTYVDKSTLKYDSIANDVIYWEKIEKENGNSFFIKKEIDLTNKRETTLYSVANIMGKDLIEIKSHPSWYICPDSELELKDDWICSLLGLKKVWKGEGTHHWKMIKLSGNDYYSICTDAFITDNNNSSCIVFLKINPVDGEGYVVPKYVDVKNQYIDNVYNHKIRKMIVPDSLEEAIYIEAINLLDIK